MVHDLHLLLRFATGREAQPSAAIFDGRKRNGDRIEVAFIDQGYTGDGAAQAAREHGIERIVIKLTEAKKGFVLLPKRWVIERSFAWTGRFRTMP